MPGSVVEPEILEALAVIDAVELGNEALDLEVMAVGDASVEEDRPRVVVGQFLFDRPHQLLALRDVTLGRLLVDQLVDLGVAVTGVPRRRAG